MRRLISLWKEPGRRWLYMRLGGLSFALLWGILFALREEHDADFSAGFLLLEPAVLPIMVVLVLGIQKDNPRVRWTKPSWYANPFSIRDPLQYFHYGATGLLAAGVGVLIGMPFGNLGVWPHAANLLVGGVSVWAGVRLYALLFRDKVEDG
jgi:hypothetical protein